MTPRRRDALDRRMLDVAARCALRATGYAEPNPLVGCVIGRVRDGDVEILGIGHHRRFGEAHAEVEALRSCARSGHNPRGATAWVTLEPCAHQGKTPPCTDAFIEAGIAEVVAARPDPNVIASGGAARLRAAGVEVRFSNVSPAACRLSEPFLKRLETGLPWVIAKWAQSIDGRIALATGESKWISNERSRLDVHRLRARVDAIITGIGTVLADDPELTARHGRRVRRKARRIVVDPELALSPTSKLARSPRTAPVDVWCDEARSSSPRAAELRSLGMQVQGFPAPNHVLDLHAALKQLVTDHDAARVMVEAGPGLLSSMFECDLVDEARIYIAPLAFADDEAIPALRGRHCRAISDAMRFELIQARRFGDDLCMQYRRR